jgi:heme exporter protein C
MQTLTQKLANPTRFMDLSARLVPWITGLAAMTIAVGLYFAWVVVHVPAAWLGLLAYVVIAVSSFGLLVFRHPLADVSAKAAAPIGAAFTLLALITGSLWGKPGWGTYWVWDARVTSVLILFFLYLGLIALRSSIEDEALAGKLAAVLGLVGVVMLPIIRFSVDWFDTLHQKASVVKASGPAIHSSIFLPLMVMAAGFSILFLAMHLKAMRNEILRRRAVALERSVVQRSAARATSTAGV